MKDFKENAKEEGTKICPRNKPFVLKEVNVCFNCYEPTPILDVSLKECIACPAGLVLRNHKCDCPVGQHYDEKGEFCVVD